MYEIVDIKEYRYHNGKVEILVTSTNHSLLDYMIKKKTRKAEIRMDDGRRISVEQRKKIYATINDIATYTGYMPEELKEFMKYLYISKTGCEYFSLSNCSMDEARAFINNMLDFTLYNGIPLKDNLVNRTDDIDRAMYYCIKHKRCAVCGQDGEIHHVDTIGMGGNRRKVDDSEYRKICLCRLHHTKAHAVGMSEFERLYAVYGLIYKEDD